MTRDRETANMNDSPIRASQARLLALSTSIRLWVSGLRGDQGALSRLFGRLLPGITRWTRGRLPTWARRRMDTEDLVQEAFLGLFRRMPPLEPRRRQAVRAYLRQSIRNRIRDEVRRAGRVEVSGVFLEAAANGESPLATVISADNAARYREAVRSLAEIDQELIVGRIELGLTYEQLAVAVGKPSAAAVRVAVRRALLRLAEEMDSGRSK